MPNLHGRNEGFGFGLGDHAGTGFAVEVILQVIWIVAVVGPFRAVPPFDAIAFVARRVAEAEDQVRLVGSSI
jgi:hypothetical protein